MQEAEKRKWDIEMEERDNTREESDRQKEKKKYENIL